MRAGTVLVLAAGLVVTSVAGAVAPGRNVMLWQDHDDAVTEGRVFIHATPDEVRRVATDFQRWPQIFSDVEWVKVSDREITFRSRTVEQTLGMKLSQLDSQLIRFDLTQGPPGAFGHAVIKLTPVDGGTQVDARMAMSVKGGLGAFGYLKRMVKEKREAKLGRDLADLARYFGTP